MSLPRRTAPAALLALTLVLILAPDALAAAGGGSAGFGHGGGFGGHGGGRGAGLYILIQILIRVALIGHGRGLIVLAAILAIAYLWSVVVPRARAGYSARRGEGRPARRRTGVRERRTQLAAAEAAEEDPLFAPDVVKPAAAELYRNIQLAWDAADRRRLSRLVAPSLMREWEQRLDDLARRGWRNRVQLLEPPTVHYLALRNATEPDRRRVTVRVEARMRDFVVDGAGRHLKRTGHPTETVRTREYWTLGRSLDGDRWILCSIERGAEGGHALDERLIATPWADEQGLRDEALVEQAAAGAPDGISPAELVSLGYAGDARAAALDLSVADPRFAPEILEVAVRRAVAAWAAAVDGGEGDLREVAEPDAVNALLHPGDPSRRTRLVVRGPRLRKLAVTGLDAAAQPPAVTVELEVEGARYIEERATARILQGDPSRRVRFSQTWRLGLGDDPAQPWRVTAVQDPAAAGTPAG